MRRLRPSVPFLWNWARLVVMTIAMAVEGVAFQLMGMKMMLVKVVA